MAHPDGEEQPRSEPEGAGERPLAPPIEREHETQEGALGEAEPTPRTTGAERPIAPPIEREHETQEGAIEEAERRKRRRDPPG